MDIQREHPEFAEKAAMWRAYRDLYAGGERLRAHAIEYLTQRQKESPKVYQERLASVFYENYIGSVIDWYAATLFRREPMLSLGGNDEQAKAFFSKFADDCDRRQTSLSDFFRKLLIETLVTGSSFALVDFPRGAGRAANRAEEDASGISRAYLTPYAADELINWSEDERGGLEWVVLRTERVRQTESGAEVETRWQYFDKENFRVYRGVKRDGRLDPELIDEGRHGLAVLRRVPLFDLRVSEGLWLMNKAALLQLEHFNKSNALSWALTMGLFAMPVVYSEREFQQIMGEAYWIQLGPGDKFGWAEPEGHVYQIAVENLTRLKDEIYRVCYLTPQARDTGAPASGLSKQRDFEATEEVLRAYGDAVKDTLKRVLQAVAAAREDGITVNVTGMDQFDIGDFSSELDDAARLLGLGIPSETLKREIFKKLAHKYLCDARQDVKDRIAGEIERGGAPLAG